MIASVFAVFGTPVHSSGGEMLMPSQVYCFGIGSPSLNAVLDALSPTFSSFGVAAGCCSTGWGGPAQAKKRAATNENANEANLLCMAVTSFQLMGNPNRAISRRRAKTASWLHSKSRRSRGRRLHPTFDYIDDVLMCHVQLEDYFLAVRRNRRASEKNFFVFAFARFGAHVQHQTESV